MFGILVIIVILLTFILGYLIAYPRYAMDANANARYYLIQKPSKFWSGEKFHDEPYNHSSNTLQRRLGMEDAGEGFRTKSCVGTFDCPMDHFTAGNSTAANTVWDGYHKTSIIPA
mgnify:CR=1 FL=1